MIATLLALSIAQAPPKATLPITGLGPAVLIENLCVYSAPVATRSERCQKYCDQAAGYYYSYVWIEAARSYEQALQHDPDCASAWLGLSKALDKWGRSKTPSAEPFAALVGGIGKAKLPAYYDKAPKDFALEQAKRLMPRASHREQLLITAKLQERGLWPDTKPDDRKKKATQTLDELLALYDDDQEAWFARAQIAEGQHGGAPFYKALLRVNPLHPGANHELVHFYEQIKRPALGWPFAEKYMESSPKIPHAFHMQAHLAMRVGKWEYTTDWSAKAYRLEKAYHREQDVKPKEDHQFNHHTESLTRALLHDGRFAELRELQREAKWYSYRFEPEWFRLALQTKDWPAAEAIVEKFRRKDKVNGAYHAALLYLERGETDRAKAEFDVMRQAEQSKRGGKSAELRLWEVQGRIECRTGHGEAGVKLLRRVVAKTKDDFSHHAWGHGAVHMETWGVAALEAGLTAEAEEAFQEALAHDAGSVTGALGLWALCDRLGRGDEAARYLKVAKRCWAKADPADFDRRKLELRAKADRLPTAVVAFGEK
jgi:hypothetical protein